MFQITGGTQEADRDLRPCFQPFAPLRNFQNAVSLHKRGDHPAAPGQGRGHKPPSYLPQAHPDKFLIFQAGYHPAAQHRLGCNRLLRSAAQAQIHQRPQQLFHDNDTGHRVSGHPKNGLASPVAQNGRFTRLDGNAMAEYLAHLGDDGGGIVLTSGGGACVNQNHVALIQRLCEGSADRFFLVRDDGIDLGRCTPLL